MNSEKTITSIEDGRTASENGERSDESRITANDGFTATAESGPAWRLLGRWLLLIGTPLLLGGLFAIHPDGSGGLEGLFSFSDLWLSLHVAMLPLLGLLGASFYVLLRGHSGRVARIGRAGVAVYVTFYVAFEAIAGIATGLLVREAHGLSLHHQEGIAAGIEALALPSFGFGLVGALGALVAVVSIGVLLRRSGAPLVPVVLLGGAPLATVFHGGTPIDAIGIGLFVVGLAWLEFVWGGIDGRTAESPSQLK